MGGFKSSDHDSAHSWLEVFDMKTQSWTASFPGPCEEPGEFVTVHVVQEKLHVMTEYGKEYSYDPKQGTWKVIREVPICADIYVWCAVENVIYFCAGDRDCMWYNYVSGKYDMIKGLEKLREKLNGSGHVHNLVYSSGKLLVIRDPKDIGTSEETKIWYAEISLETRCKGSEIWGNVEWVDVMFTFPCNSSTYTYQHCLYVSV